MHAGPFIPVIRFRSSEALCRSWPMGREVGQKRRHSSSYFKDGPIRRLGIIIGGQVVSSRWCGLNIRQLLMSERFHMPNLNVK